MLACKSTERSRETLIERLVHFEIVMRCALLVQLGSVSRTATCAD